MRHIMEILTNIDHLSQANYILEQMGYQPKQPEDAQPKKEPPPVQPEPFLQRQNSGLTQGTISTSNEKKQPVRGRSGGIACQCRRRNADRNPSESWSISDKE